MNIKELLEELDAYGTHLPVLIETDDGELYEVASVGSSSRSEGVITFLTIGERYEPDEPEMLPGM